MKRELTIVLLFVIIGGAGFKSLELVLDSSTAFLFAMVLTALFAFALTRIKVKEGLGFDTTFQNLLIDGDTSVSANAYEDEGGRYYDNYLGKWMDNDENRAFIRFRDLEVKRGRVYGNVAGQNQTGVATQPRLENYRTRRHG
jgi:hypothetical protein